MSPELDLLDELLGRDLAIDICRSIFNDDERFVHAALQMLSAGEIVLLDEDGTEIPKWKWAEILQSNTGNARVQITDIGAKRIV